MPTPPGLTYHSQTCRLLALMPEVDPEAGRAVDGWEQATGHPVPAAVREWYTLAGAEAALADPGGDCGPVPLADVLARLGPALDRQTAGRRPEPVVLFAEWRTGGGWEAVLTPDGSDDPPVRPGADLAAVRFTHYVLNMAWWRQTYHGRPARAYGAERPTRPTVAFGPPHLDFLAEHFEELPRARRGWFAAAPPPARATSPDPHTFRFFRPGWFVEVVANGDPAVGVRPAVYVLTAASPERLRELDAFVWPCRTPWAGG